MKMHKLCLLGVVCAATTLAPIAATAQPSPAATTSARVVDDRDDNHHDYGWVGLLGLLGLAGLMKKRHDDHRHDTTTTRTDVRR
ncbi:MAG: WGxxGxxG-CTERM domain-containing protein [Chthoniobacterales bacterium]|nr:WGxxGxxG-CTERM domain-containing protein [Chthoniobacterales bacterium]